MSSGENRILSAAYVLSSSRPATDLQEGGVVSLRLDVADELDDSKGLEEPHVRDDEGDHRDAGGPIEVTFTIPPPQDMEGVDLHPVMPISDREEEDLEPDDDI